MRRFNEPVLDIIQYFINLDLFKFFNGKIKSKNVLLHKGGWELQNHEQYVN